MLWVLSRETKATFPVTYVKDVVKLLLERREGMRVRLLVDSHLANGVQLAKGAGIWPMRSQQCINFVLHVFALSVNERGGS